MGLSVRYMGSKRAIAARIADRITADHPNAAVLDVFAGMCAVGSELAPRHAIMTNDIHAFAETVAYALFAAPAPPPTSLDARADLLAAYRRNANALKAILAADLQREAEALARSGDLRGWQRLLDYTQADLEEGVKPLQGLPSFEAYRLDPGQFPYCLATTHFRSTYFGLAQAIEIDSLRYAIDQASSAVRPYYLTALIQAMSQCAAAPGHFAQFLVPRDRKNTAYIGRMRSRGLLSRFYDALDTVDWPHCINRSATKTFCSDATELLENWKTPGPGEFVIYADPPYSRAQYSRYYHVLETVVLYDYPGGTGKGRYRGDRSQTGFSRAAAVRNEFDRFASAAAKTGAKVYLSYPTNGLFSKGGGQIELLLSNHFKKVSRVERILLNHSTLGASSGKATVPVHEDVYYATND